MAERRSPPRVQPGNVIPYLTVKGAKAAVDFYTRAFGAEELFRQPADDGERLLHARLSLNGGTLMLSDDFPEHRGGTTAAPPSGVTLHLQVEEPDALWNRAVAAGAEVAMPLADQFWGDRYGQLKDPFGHRWSIGGPIKA
jgi:PhnB protein